MNSDLINVMNPGERVIDSSHMFRRCDECKRNSFPADGKRIPLEVCRDAITERWLCLRCYLNQPDQR